MNKVFYTYRCSINKLHLNFQVYVDKKKQPLMTFYSFILCIHGTLTGTGIICMEIPL